MFSYEEISNLMEKGFSKDDIMTLAGEVTAQAVPPAPIDGSNGDGGSGTQNKGGDKPLPLQPDSPTPSPEEYYQKDTEKKDPIPFGGGQLQETFNKMLEQMAGATQALTEATKANQASNAQHLEMPNGGSAGDTIESITASIIDPSYSKTKEVNKDGSK